MNLLVASIIAVAIVLAAGIFAWSRRRPGVSANGETTEMVAAQAAQQAHVAQQMLQAMQTTQAELARQRDSLQQALAHQRETTTADQARLREELRKSLGDNQQVLQQRLSEANQTINVRLGQAAKMFNEINRGLGTVSEFSKQLTNLRDVFQSPKLRGNIGEEILKQLLEQVLPTSHFAMQFKFREGQVVDAIVKTKQGLIPIDSKFPLENYRALQQREVDEPTARRAFVRDVKKHIDAIRTKYILPEQGTVDFAVMYVPSEAIYYEIVQNSQELLDHASEHKVYLVSPNTFYYFLKVILIGLEGARMEELSRQVLSLLRTVQKDAGAFGEELSVMTRHITNAKNASDRVTGKFERLAGTLDNVRLLDTPGAKPPVVEAQAAQAKPSVDATQQELIVDLPDNG
ncbi:MAG: DNA recombination protein RmuC [Candidatus Andersenbacteria bacterium]